MRDLAQQSFGVNRRSGKSKLLILVIFILIVFGGGAFLIKRIPTLGGLKGSQNIILEDAPLGLKPVPIEGISSFSDKGVDLTTQEATFKDVKYGGRANARATRSYGGGTYILSVEANIPDPGNGPLFQVWLVSGDAFLPVDFMRGSKNSWSLNLRDVDKYSKYRGIWITLERTKQDNKPEEHVLVPQLPHA